MPDHQQSCPDAPAHRHDQAWSDYIRSVIGHSKQMAVAERTGLDQATISRWVRGGKPGDPYRVSQFARAYPETSVGEAFVAAGFMLESDILQIKRRSDQYTEGQIMTMETQRQQLQEQDPDLYAYVTAVEAVRVLDKAVTESDDTLDTRRVLLRMKGQYKTRAEVLQSK